MGYFIFHGAGTTTQMLGTGDRYIGRGESPAARAVIAALLALNVLGIVAIVAISLLR